MKNKLITAISSIIVSSLFGSITISAESKPQWDISQESLAEAYSDYFLFGNIMEPSHLLDENTAEMYKHQYNAVTAENAMKPVSISKEKGKYNFANADKLVNWANENNIQMHGHTLVWHSQSSKWLTTGSDGKILTREEARANMQEYITEVAGHYAGKVVSWDVVNEAFSTSVTSIPLSWKSVLRKHDNAPEGSPWYQAYENGSDPEKGESGADYIYDAFVFTRIADPNAILYYNDYNETTIGKRESIAMMVEDLNAKWKDDSRNTEPSRLLIEGIGLQSHYWTDDISISDVEKTIARFAKTGAEISVSELDIPHGKWNSYKQRTTEPTAEEGLLQANLYKQLFEIYKKYSDNITRVTIWGKADPQSWRREGYPTLFDKNFKPKQAYNAVLEVSKTSNQPIPEENPVIEEPVNSIENDNSAVSDVSDNSVNENDVINNEKDESKNNSSLVIIAVIAAAVIAAVVIFIFARNKKK